MANIVSQTANNAADAAALAAAAANIPNATPEAMTDAYLDRCREWGEKAGAGDTSKVGWIVDTARSAWNGWAQPGTGPQSHAAQAYEAHRKARIQKAGEMGKRIAENGDDRSRNNRIAEINKYMKVGALPLIHDGGPDNMGGYGTIKRAVKLIRERDDIKGEVEDLLSKVATAQRKSPNVVLEDDLILDVLRGTDKPQKVELSNEEAEAKLWGNVIVQIDSIRGKFANEPSATVVPAREDSNILHARQAIANRIHALGGTPAQRAAQAKQAAKDLAKQQATANGKAKRKRK